MMKRQRNKMNYTSILEILENNSDPKLVAFNSRLKSQVSKDYGVKIPVLRNIAKKIIKEDPDLFLKIAKEDTQEEIMLQGMVIALSNFPTDKKLKLISNYLDKITNWALCDVFCGDLKPKSNQLKEYYNFIVPYLSSEAEFKCRFAVVMLMNYYINEDYIDQTFHHLISIKHEGYYVKMAIAWALSKIYVSYPDKTLQILEENILDPFTHNKSIQKMIESNRISSEDKAKLRTLKKQ